MEYVGVICTSQRVNCCCVCVQVQEQWQFTICIMYVVGIHDFTMRRYWLIVVAVAAVAAGSSRATDLQTYLPMLYYAAIYIVLPLSLCFNARTHRVSASRIHACVRRPWKIYLRTWLQSWCWFVNFSFEPAPPWTESNCASSNEGDNFTVNF